jgi:hypothetical protein
MRLPQQSAVPSKPSRLLLAASFAHSTPKGGLFQRYQPKAGLVVPRDEVKAIRITAFGNDHRDRRLELLARDGCRRHLVDLVLADVISPASVRLLESLSGVAGTL